MIYKDAYGELWCECSNRIHLWGFYPVDASGEPIEIKSITGDERMYRCEHCTAVVNIDQVPDREEPTQQVSETETKPQAANNPMEG